MIAPKFVALTSICYNEFDGRLRGGQIGQPPSPFGTRGTHELITVGYGIVKTIQHRYFLGELRFLNSPLDLSS